MLRRWRLTIKIWRSPKKCNLTLFGEEFFFILLLFFFLCFRDNKDGISRAYENIGRVYARNGKYKEAIAAWENKLPMAESDMENAWLFHEIGRCHLELGNYETARDYGKKSLTYAEKMNDDHWKLNATVLIAQSEAKMSDAASLQNAVEHFEKAIGIAEKQDDESAVKAIRKAMEECQTKLRKTQTASPKSDKTNNSDKIKKEKDDKEKKEREEKEREEKAKKEREEKERKDREEDDKKLIKYDISMKTADEMGAGTDSNVLISIFGDRNDELNVPLKENKSKRDPFEKGRFDHFEAQLKNVGKVSIQKIIEQKVLNKIQFLATILFFIQIKKIAVEIDAKTKDSAWKLESVRIFHNKELYMLVFVC